MTETKILEENVVPGQPRLGRHVHHDPRSLQYPFRAEGVTLVSKRWSTDSDVILDQGQLGSCTGNATVGALICSLGPLHAALSDTQKAGLNESLAVKVYEQATKTDPISGQYPPTDTGSDGLDAAKAAQTFGYIKGYTHALSLNDVLAALTQGPVIIGIEWLQDMFNPAPDGRLSLTGSVAGGHEICLDEIDVENKRVWIRNSWANSWGVNGRAYLTWDDLATLLKRQGDATVFVPLDQPAPTPTPVPPAPTPTPAPVDSADEALAQVLHHWLDKDPFFYIKVQAACEDWLQSKGL